MLVVDALKSPIIFPKLTLQLIDEYDFIVTGKTQGDCTLAEIIFYYDNNADELPDLMIYNVEKKEWKSVYADVITIKFMPNRQIEYNYKRLRGLTKIKQFNFLHLSSSCALSRV